MAKLVAILLLPVAALSQAFLTATVRLSAPDSTGSRLIENSTSFEFLDSSVTALLALAYQVNPPNVSGPAWIGSEAVDVIASKPPNTTGEDERRMLQTLLADRFKLVVHRASYTLTAYDLVVVTGGPKARTVAGTVAALPIGRTLKGPARSLEGNLSMGQLAAALETPLESPVADDTGLIGAFAVRLRWSPEDAIAAELPGATFPPLAEALEQQLGLKLIARKIKVDTLVVDGGQKIPVGN
jgi:uncharacterized protein (TIGR03435 family)